MMTSSFGSAIAIEDNVNTEYLPQLFFLIQNLILVLFKDLFSGVQVMRFHVFCEGEKSSSERII